MKVDQAFWNLVDKRGEDQCWIWRGPVDRVNGAARGRTKLPGTTRQGPPHRYAYELLIGSIPERRYLQRACSETLCCNPWHYTISKLPVGGGGARGRRGRREPAGRELLISRFWAKVDKGGGMPADASLGNCWIWLRARSRPNPEIAYGSALWLGREQKAAHIVSYLIENGLDAMEAGAFVCHHCDVSLCVRPSHLYKGDVVTNARDRAKRNPGSWCTTPRPVRCVDTGVEYASGNAAARAIGGVSAASILQSAANPGWRSRGFTFEFIP